MPGTGLACRSVRVVAALRQLLRIHIDPEPFAMPLAAGALAGVDIAAVFALAVVRHGKTSFPYSNSEAKSLVYIV